jgi:hypothetical protein
LAYRDLKSENASILGRFTKLGRGWVLWFLLFFFSFFFFLRHWAKEPNQYKWEAEQKKEKATSGTHKPTISIQIAIKLL